MRNVPEERIAATYGVPPILASLGTGLQHVRQNATISVLRLEFVENTVLPLIIRIQEQMNEQFVDSIPNADSQPFEYDISSMPALQIAEERRIKLIIQRFQAGYINEDEARAMDGLRDLENAAKDGDERQLVEVYGPGAYLSQRQIRKQLQPKIKATTKSEPELDPEPDPEPEDNPEIDIQIVDKHHRLNGLKRALNPALN